MLAGADENFVAGDGVAAINMRFRFGAQHAEISAAMRLGQAHGAGPLPGGDFGQVDRLLLGRAVRMQAFVRAVRQAGIHRPRLIAGIPEFVAGLIDHQRQPLAAVIDVAGQRCPTAFNKLLVGRFKPGGGGDGVGDDVQGATFKVAGLVERKQHLGRKFAAFLKDGHDGGDVGIRVRRQRRQLGWNIKQFLHHKTHVAQGWGVGWHGDVSGCNVMNRLLRIVTYARFNLSFETVNFCSIEASLYGVCNEFHATEKAIATGG